MTRRPAHKVAHATCPYGAANWAACDEAASHRWGRCKAEVERKGSQEPGECARWAQDGDGYCVQHFIAARERELEAQRRAARKLQLDKAIDAFIEKSSDLNWRWWEGLTTSADSTRGLAGITTALPPHAVLVPRGEPQRLESGRKKPHRLTELA